MGHVIKTKGTCDEDEGLTTCLTTCHVMKTKALQLVSICFSSLISFLPSSLFLNTHSWVLFVTEEIGHVIEEPFGNGMVEDDALGVSV